jgi:hypothetical protein
MEINHPLNTINFTEIKTKDSTLWYSYQTLIAFQTATSGIVVRENEWSTTTGKHLNYLCLKENRVSREKFYQLAERYGIEI